MWVSTFLGKIERRRERERKWERKRRRVQKPENVVTNGLERKASYSPNQAMGHWNAAAPFQLAASDMTMLKVGNTYWERPPFLSRPNKLGRFTAEAGLGFRREDRQVIFRV